MCLRDGIPNAALTSKEAEQLVEEYMGLVKYISSGYKTAGLDHDDFTQEGFIGLLDAIRGFDPERGVSFKTFASVCIRNRLNKQLAAVQAKKHSALNQSIPLDEMSAAETSGNPEMLLLQKEKQLEVNQQIKALLSSFEKETLLLYLEGYSYENISSKLGVTRKSVDNALVRIRKKLKFLLN